MAGKSENCKGCPNANIRASAKPDEDIPLITEKLNHIKSIIAIMPGKVGVGKSTNSFNIAKKLSSRKIKTLILDMDLSGPSIPRLTNSMDELIFINESGFKPIQIDDFLYSISLGYLENSDDSIVYSSTVKNFILKKILKYCDFSNIEAIIIDTSPNIPDEHLALATYIKPSGEIFVTTPQKLSMDDVRRQISFCKKSGKNILGLIENMKGFECSNCKSINKIYNDTAIENQCKEENILYLGFLPLKSSYAKNSDSGIQIEDPFLSVAVNMIESKMNHNT
ncbi:unnamed protein product [Brachionus calyciflorus]|uniref:Uncharacterized protein n=1 Tax=Brachionus calyciflorus TaxID=104777 RepID=A0A813ZSA0_9BILA|nr:unnamed protein product [Brachionus calyciflorus]